MYTETLIISYKNLPPQLIPPPFRFAKMDTSNIYGVFQYKFHDLLLFVGYQLRGNSVNQHTIIFSQALCVGQCIFTDDPRFRLSGYINSHNIIIRSAENPHAEHENPLH